MSEDHEVLSVLPVFNYSTGHENNWFLPFEITAFSQSKYIEVKNVIEWLHRFDIQTCKLTTETGPEVLSISFERQSVPTKLA